MVIVMGGSSQLCCYCNEVTERTSDGDRLACSICGRPYLVARTSRCRTPAQLICPQMTKNDDPRAAEAVIRPASGHCMNIRMGRSKV